MPKGLQKKKLPLGLVPSSSRFSSLGQDLLKSCCKASVHKILKCPSDTRSQHSLCFTSNLSSMKWCLVDSETQLMWLGRLWNGPHMQERKVCPQRQDWKSAFAWCLSNKVIIGVGHSISSRIWEKVPEQKAKILCKTNDWLTAFLGYMKPQLPKILYLKSPYKYFNHG